MEALFIKQTRKKSELKLFRVSHLGSSVLTKQKTSFCRWSWNIGCKIGVCIRTPTWDTWQHSIPTGPPGRLIWVKRYSARVCVTLYVQASNTPILLTHYTHRNLPQGLSHTQAHTRTNFMYHYVQWMKSCFAFCVSNGHRHVVYILNSIYMEVVVLKSFRI